MLLLQPRLAALSPQRVSALRLILSSQGPVRLWSSKARILETLNARGLLAQATAVHDGFWSFSPSSSPAPSSSSESDSSKAGNFPGLNESLLTASSGPPAVYCGFDPTASSLHVGNLVPLITLLHFQRAGFRPIGLVGGATGLIGDPSGRATERTQMRRAEIEHNTSCIAQNIRRIFENSKFIDHFYDHYQTDDQQKERTIQEEGKKNEGGEEPFEEVTGGQCPPRAEPIFVNNLSWYTSMSSLEFVGNVGRHFRINSMLSKDVVQSRLNSEEGISFTEFTYQVFQGYDFLELFRHHNCRIQIGGSDQWGNLTAGTELIRKVTGASALGLTIPLITTAKGEKFGKSAGNAIWLDGEKTSPYQFYQFFLNSDDRDVEKYLRMFTFLPLAKIEFLMQQHAQHSESRIPHKALAEEVTRLVHSEAGLKSALAAVSALYGSSSTQRKGGSGSNFDAAEQSPSFQELRSHAVPLDFDEYVQKKYISTLIFDLKCCSSKNEAKRLVAQGAVTINGRKVGKDRMLEFEDARAEESSDVRLTVARVGKKGFGVVQWK